MHLRILLLDDGIEDLRFLPEQGISLGLTRCVDQKAGGDGVSIKGLQLLAAAEKVDYHAIIIGDNGGAGVRYAEHVPASKRPQTLIVWPDWTTPEQIAPYAKLGFYTFTIRQAVPGCLIEMARSMESICAPAHRD